MTLLEINEQFKAITDSIEGLNQYSFGWPSDRTRSKTLESDGEDVIDLFPRVHFAVPTFIYDPVLKNITYQTEIYFDDLLGYDDDGNSDTATQVQKWSNLSVLAQRWVNELQKKKQSGVASGNINIVLDSFASTQRLISVIATFTYQTKSTC